MGQHLVPHFRDDPKAKRLVAHDPSAPPARLVADGRSRLVGAWRIAVEAVRVVPLQSGVEAWCLTSETPTPAPDARPKRSRKLRRAHGRRSSL